MSTVIDLLLATGNPAKAAKLRWLVEGLPYAPLNLSAHPEITLPEETGGSFGANARLKAVAASNAFGGLALASDGGVAIPDLGDAWEPLRTGRAAGAGATDVDKAQYLLQLMTGRTGGDRAVQWHEAVALAHQGRVLGEWDAAETSGQLTETYNPAGALPGFWVYSLWWFPELGKRYVDCTPSELEGADKTWRALRALVRTWAEHGSPPT